MMKKLLPDMDPNKRIVVMTVGVVTGFSGTTSVAETGSDVILDRTIKIRFDGSLERGMGWKFKPVVREMEIRIGETGLAFYEAWNPTDKRITGSASYNVFPYEAGGFFTKIDCFCFTEQTLDPGEKETELNQTAEQGTRTWRIRRTTITTFSILRSIPSSGHYRAGGPR